MCYQLNVWGCERQGKDDVSKKQQRAISIKLVRCLCCVQEIQFLETFFFNSLAQDPQFLTEVNDDGLFLLRTKRGAVDVCKKADG